MVYMPFKYFSHNGKILPVKQAVVPLSNIAYSYGFGVYETVRVINGTPYFLIDHLERLGESARIIGIDHPFTGAGVEESISQLIAKNKVNTCNVKILLIGGAQKEDAQLYILCLNPLFPDKSLYRDGASFITCEYERAFPHAKTLNMLQSYLAYRDAKASGAYDALLLDNNGCIVEGTRTNFFCIMERTIITPPEDKILLGVTRKALLQVAQESDFTVHEQSITWGDICGYDGAFVTSTSSKIVPVRAIDDAQLPEIPQNLRELMQLFDTFLDTCKGEMGH